VVAEEKLCARRIGVLVRIAAEYELSEYEGRDRAARREAQQAQEDTTRAAVGVRHAQDAKARGWVVCDWRSR
jgi:hypothetical protein